MKERRPATPAEIQEALRELPGWSVANGKLYRRYAFESFGKALGWMVSAGIEAEKMDHHPEWSNVYNRVTVYLATHDLGDEISPLDLELAARMERLAGSQVL